jgi:hypothetical protein
VAYDEQLAARIRAAVASQAGVTEQKMFGGLAFLVNGNMAIAASGQGGALVRVDPEDVSLASAPGVSAFVMRGRPMDGWLRVDGDHLRNEDELLAWVERGTGYARSLPAKKR